MAQNEIKVGSPVICLGGHIAPGTLFVKEITFPKQGNPYTIRELVHTKHGTGVRLNEIKNSPYYFSEGIYEEPIFGIETFKLVS
ncbi:MAG: hypothetical protein WA101_03090 [Minisyncoccia bacterium]